MSVANSGSVGVSKPRPPANPTTGANTGSVGVQRPRPPRK